MKIRQRVNRLNIAAIGGSHIEVVRRCRAYAEVYCRASLRNGRNYTNPFGRRPKRADCAECFKLRVRRSSRDPNLILGDWQHAADEHGMASIGQSQLGGSVDLEYKRAYNEAIEYGVLFLWVDDPNGLFPPAKRPIPP